MIPFNQRHTLVCVPHRQTKITSNGRFYFIDSRNDVYWKIEATVSQSQRFISVQHHVQQKLYQTLEQADETPSMIAFVESLLIRKCAVRVFECECVVSAWLQIDKHNGANQTRDSCHNQINGFIYEFSDCTMFNHMFYFVCANNSLIKKMFRIFHRLWS